MAAARRNQAPGKPITPMVMLVAVAVAGYGIYQGYPGIAAIWAGLLVSAWTYPPAMFTGKKDSRGYPAPAHPGEQAAMNTYRFWEDMKFKLALPNADWLPGLKPRLSFLVALWAGAVAFLVPVVDETYTHGYGPWINAAAAFIAVAQFTASRRRTQVADDENPGARIDSLIRLFGGNTAKAIGLFVGGIIVGTITGTITTVLLPLATTAASVPAIPEAAIWALCLTGGPLALLSRAWITEALEHWRIVVAAREEWKSRWEMLKQDPAPRLIDRQEIGAAIIDTFDAPAGTGAMPYWVMADKISPTLGTGAKFAVLDVPNLDSNNSPVPGTKHPLRFEIVRWPSDQMPDITDPATPKDVVYQLVRCAIAWAADGVYSRPVIDDVHLLTAPATPDGPEDGEEAAPATAGKAAWAITWFLPDGPPASYIRANGRHEMMEALQAEVLIDHRARSGLGCAYAGALSDPDTTWDPACGLTGKDMKKLSDEDAWNQRWAEAAPKHKANPPVMEASTANTARLKNGVTVNTLAFITRQGMTPHDFFVFENALPSTLNAAPFVAMTGYPGSGKRQGERHPQAFSVYWSSEAVPAKPDDLAPVPRSDAPRWVLAGLINQAFKAAKLADRPEIAAATCLTKETSRQHIWKIDLRLYGGVTLSDVRTAAQRIRQHWASEWLRVSAAPDGCTIVVGARPSKPGLQLSSPRHEQYLESLNWDQVFLDSGISGIGGLMPVLTNVDHMPRNAQVSILDFDLPTGLDFTSFTGVRGKLESNSGNSFVEPRRIKNASNKIQLLTCEVNPMPERADYDWDHVDSSNFIPFATGVDGEPIEYNFRLDPHLLIAGASGGGKLQQLNSWLPVPVSERFPTGWAMNKELIEGDLVFTPDGTTTPLLGFSDTVTEPSFNVEFDDGQVVKVGGGHLWKVSSAASRAARTPLKTTAREARELHRNTAAGRLRELVEEIGAGTVAPLDDIARLAGHHELSLYQMSLPIAELATVLNLPSKKKSKQFDMDPVAAWLGSSKNRAGGIITFAGKTLTIAEANQLGLAGQWLTMREMTDTILGRPSTLNEREAAKLILRRLRPASREGYTTFATPVYPVDEVLTILAERLEYQAVRSDSGIQTPDLESVISTREMAKMVNRETAARTTLNYAVRATAPIDGPDSELPVDPYVMGAWLGDGSTGSGGFTGIDREITDEIEAAGYSMSHAADGKSHYIRGLSKDLRAAGVLGNKHIPAIYLRASYEQRLALLQGLMDTDGTINANGSSEIDLCHKPLADGLLELIRSLGIIVEQRPRPAAITEADPDNPGQTRQRVTGTRYRLKFSTGLPIFRLPRKLERIPTELRGTQQWNYITDITVSEPEPMRCLKVEHPEHLYLTHGFIPTHNSVLLQSLAYGSLVRDYELYIADPTKGGADFKFAEPYAKAFTATPFEAAAMMKAIYKEVVRRKDLNSAHGVGNYRDLPEDVRPKHIVILLDEFTSLMGQDPVPAASDDPEMDAEREMILATNRAKTEVGVYTGKIAREARSAGVTLFLATQKLAAKMLDTIPGAGDLKVNLSRLLMGKATYGDKQSALRAPQDAPELGDAIPPGRGLFETTAGSAMAIQAWYNTAEQRILAEKLAERITVLDEADKMDITPFMMKLPEAAGEVFAPSPAPRQPAAAAVVDLGEIELDFDDLDWSETELEDGGDGPSPDGQAADTASGHAAGADDLSWPEVETDAALLLDVDGVIAPFTFRDGLDHLAAPGHGTVMFDPAIVARMAAVPVSQAWLTSWEDDAPDNFGHLFPRATDVLVADTEVTGWWKIDAAMDWIRENPQIRRFVWIDDELASEDIVLGLSYRDIAADAFEAAGVDALLVVPNPDIGVTASDLEEIEAFFGVGRAPAAADKAVSGDVIPAVAAVPEELDWAEMEADVTAPGRTPEPEVLDPFATPAAAVIPDTLDDPFADEAPAPKKRFVPDDDDPFA